MKNEILHEKKEFANVRELVEWASVTYRDQYAYSYRVKPHDQEIKQVTFRQLRNDIRALASEMLAMGCAGKNCVIIGKFSYDWVLTYFATLTIGAVLVPLDREWLPTDLADTVKCRVVGNFMHFHIKNDFVVNIRIMSKRDIGRT